MSKLKMKARAGVTLVELLVVILIVTILSVSLLPLLKPYIEQAKYAADVQPALASIQTKIDLYQYEKDRLPGADVDSTQTPPVETITENDARNWGWGRDPGVTEHRVYKPVIWVSTQDGAADTFDTVITDFSSKPESLHLSRYINVTWQDLTGRRLNPSQFRYHIIKGFGAALYGYAIGVFGDGDGLAKGTGYAILNLVDTENKEKIVATWERYSPKSDDVVAFCPSSTGIDPDEVDQDGKFVNATKCWLPVAADYAKIDNATGKSALQASDWQTIRENLKLNGWAFNFDDDGDQSNP